MGLRYQSVAVTLAAAMAWLYPLAGVAAADDKVVLGGGAGIVVAQNYCTLATIGHDKTGELVGFTAGHCGGPGASVIAEGADNRGPVGTVVDVGDNMDYGVIRFDPAKVSPTANYAGFPVSGIGPDPDWHQPACTNGAANGVRCGGIATMPGPGPRAFIGRSPFQPGDDGGPVTCDDRLIGIASGGMGTPGDLQGQGPHQFTEFTKFSAIMNDVNAKNAVGTGFSPM